MRLARRVVAIVELLAAGQGAGAGRPNPVHSSFTADRRSCVWWLCGCPCGPVTCANAPPRCRPRGAARARRPSGETCRRAAPCRSPFPVRERLSVMW